MLQCLESVHQDRRHGPDRSLTRAAARGWVHYRHVSDVGQDLIVKLPN